MSSEKVIDHFGSIVILFTTIQRKIFLQRKTSGYPYEEYVGKLQCPGGAWSEASDQNPRDTMEREIDEEFGPGKLCEQIKDNLSFLAALDLLQPDLEQEEEFWAREIFFVSEVEFTLDELEFHEYGEPTILSPEKLDGEEFAWGHDHGLQLFFGQQDIGIEMDPDTEGELVTEIEPRSYEDWDLSQLENNPLEKGGKFLDNMDTEPPDK